MNNMTTGSRTGPGYILVPTRCILGPYGWMGVREATWRWLGYGVGCAVGAIPQSLLLDLAQVEVSLDHLPHVFGLLVGQSGQIQFALHGAATVRTQPSSSGRLLDSLFHRNLPEGSAHSLNNRRNLGDI